MNRLIHRRAALRAVLALGTPALAGPARACEYFASNLRIAHPWTRASEPQATSAIVCLKFDEVTLTDRLIGVQTPVASGAEMSDAEVGGAAAGQPVNLLIPAGLETVLGETGTCLRLVGLKFPLEVARSYPLRLVFDIGGAVDATLNIDYSRFL